MSDLPKAKKLLEGKLMPLEYVSGVGVSGDRIAVYVSRQLTDAEKAHVDKTVNAEAPNIAYAVHTTGEFGKQ
jgi:hypothetical protein